MRRRWGGSHRSDDVETALANFALTFAKALLVFCVILFVMISEDKKTEDGIRPKAEAIIDVTWDGDTYTDVDTWLRLPTGNIMYYLNKEVEDVFLDRDDLGNVCIKSCEEITSLRALKSGEYVLNLFVFAARGTVASNMDGDPLPKPVKVHIKIVKLNPTIMTVFETDVSLTYMHQEMHVIRFTIVDGELTNFNHDRPTKLVTRIKKQN